jgi:hypothetical protein
MVSIAAHSGQAVSTSVDVSPATCSRFNCCNASICPLDPRWREAAHLPGEKCCYYLLASQKPDAAERFADDPVFAQVLEEAPAVCAKHPRIGRTVAEASKSGFQGDHLRRQNGVNGQKTRTDIEVTPSLGLQSRPGPVEPATARREVA